MSRWARILWLPVLAGLLAVAAGIDAAKLRSTASRMSDNPKMAAQQMANSTARRLGALIEQNHRLFRSNGASAEADTMQPADD